jgi:hypothetical protein
VEVSLLSRSRRHARRAPASRLAAILAACLAAAALAGGAFASASSAHARRVPSAHTAALSPQEAAALRQDDRGVYTAYCPGGEEVASIAAFKPLATVAEANHEGWPADECLKMDKGTAGFTHTLLGLEHVHNWLLGGYGNDTLYAGERGDVLWGDYHPEGQSEGQRSYIHGGGGEDWIYSSHGYNEIWTGAGDDHLALVYGHGIVYCNGKGVKTFVMRYLPQNRPWTLVGCAHKVIDPYRA